MKTQDYRLLMLLMLGAVLIVGQLYVTLPMTSALASNWQVTTGQAAWAGSAFGFAYAAGFLLLGRLSDLHGRRRVLLLSLAATAAASVVVAIAPNFNMLLGARALQGLVAAGFPPAALALVAETLPPARRPLGISLMSFAFLAAAPAAQLLAAQFAGLGLHVIMLALAAGYALLAIGLYRLLPTGMACEKEGAIAANPVPMWRQTQLMGPWLAACTVLFAFVSLHAGAQITGFSESQLQTLRLAGLPPLLICLVAARLVSRIGPVRTARAGLVLSAIALMVGLRDGFWWVAAASVLLSAGIALAVPGLIGTVASRATADFRARAMSLYTFFLFVGASIAPPVAQALAPHGWGALLWAPIAALLAAAAVVNGWSSRWPSVPQPSEHRIS